MMNIDVVARFNYPEDDLGKFVHHSSKILVSELNGLSCQCQEILEHGKTLDDLFQRHVRPFVHAFVSGFNTCLFLMGEKSSGQNILLNGHALELQGIVGHLMLTVFEQPNQDVNLTRKARNNSAELKIKAYIVRGENIEDLLTGNAYAREKLHLCDTIENGFIVKGLNDLTVRNAREANEIGNAILSRYFALVYGTNRTASTEPVGFFLRLNLSSSHVAETDNPTRSTLTVFALTGVESLNAVLRQPQSADLRTHGIVSLYELINQLAAGPPGKRDFPNYGISVLTRLLLDELGGNCFTRVLFSLPAKPDPEAHAVLVHMASRLTRIVNCPVVNDQAALLWAAHARELTRHALQMAQSTAITGTKATTAAATKQPEGSAGHAIVYTDARNLRQNVNELTRRLEQLNQEYLHNTDERVRLSKIWMMGEEQNVRLNEQLATAQTDLNELRIKNGELECVASKAVEASKRAIELKRANDLLNGYCTDLHKKLDDLQRELTNSAERNEELSRELFHQLRKQKEYLEHVTIGPDSKAWRLEAMDELKRIESMMEPQLFSTKSKRSPQSRVVHELFQELTTVPVSDKATNKEAQAQKSTKHNEIAGRKLTAMNRNEKKLSDIETQLVLVTAERDQMKQEIDKEHKKFVHFLDHFRTRLVYHIHGITHLVDASRSNDQVVADHAVQGLGRYLRHLLADMNAAHKVRESQLMSTIQKTQHQIKIVRESMKQIMLAYVHARIQIVDHGLNANELGPPPLELLDQAAKVVGNSSFQLHLNSTVLATITQPNHQVRREKNKTEQPNQQNRSNMTTGKPSFKSARR